MNVDCYNSRDFFSFLYVILFGNKIGSKYFWVMVAIQFTFRTFTTFLALAYIKTGKRERTLLSQFTHILLKAYKFVLSVSFGAKRDIDFIVIAFWYFKEIPIAYFSYCIWF